MPSSLRPAPAERTTGQVSWRVPSRVMACSTPGHQSARAPGRYRGEPRDGCSQACLPRFVASITRLSPSSELPESGRPEHRSMPGGLWGLPSEQAGGHLVVATCRPGPPPGMYLQLAPSTWRISAWEPAQLRADLPGRGAVGAPDARRCSSSCAYWCLASPAALVLSHWLR